MIAAPLERSPAVQGGNLAEIQCGAAGSSGEGAAKKYGSLLALAPAESKIHNLFTWLPLDSTQVFLL